MQFQTEPHQPFPRFRKESLGVDSTLKAQGKIVGVADDDDVAARSFLALGLNPRRHLRREY